MKLRTARSILIFGSMFSISSMVAGLYIGSATTLFPIDIADVSGVLKIALPTFFGYLGSASHFIFKDDTLKNNPKADVVVPHLGALLLGSLFVFFVICISGLISFFIINSPLLHSSKLNPGKMEVSDLETVFTLAISLLSLTTGVIATNIFENKNANKDDLS